MRRFPGRKSGLGSERNREPPLVVRPEAQADLLAARDWYGQQRPGLGDDFSDAAEELLDRIAATPKLYPATLTSKLRRFPYVVYYRMLADCVEVLAVLHGSRNPQIWQDRV